MARNRACRRRDPDRAAEVPRAAAAAGRSAPAAEDPPPARYPRSQPQAMTRRSGARDSLLFLDQVFAALGVASRNDRAVLGVLWVFPHDRGAHALMDVASNQVALDLVEAAQEVIGEKRMVVVAAVGDRLVAARGHHQDGALAQDLLAVENGALGSAHLLLLGQRPRIAA